MPIKVQCACGAAFAAKDELAGRTVKCPKCQQPLTIPAAGAAPVAAQAAPARQAQPAAAPRQVAAPLPSQTAPVSHPGGDLFAEAGLNAMQAGMGPCPSCANPMPINAIVCIKCGYNKKIGRRMDVVKQTGGTEVPGGHSATVEEMLSKAAVRIEEDKEEERKKTKEGMPWWGYLIGLTVVLGFMITMMLLPQQLVMRASPFMIYGIAGLINLYVVIRIIIIAFEEGIAHGVGCLVCWVYMVVYCIRQWDRCGTLLIVWIVTNVIGFAAGFGAGYMLQTMDQEESRLPHQRPPAATAFDSAWRLIPPARSEAA